MTEAPKLEPCPFCGGQAHIGRDPCADGGGRFAFVKCGSCGAKSREHYHSYGNDCPVMYSEIRSEWNRRDDAEVQRLVAEARAEAFGEAAALLDKHHSAPIGPADHWSSEYADAHCDGQVDAAASWKRVIRALSDAPPRHGDMTSLGQPVSFTYTNWRGETARRTAIPKRVWFGTTEWHKGPGWLMTAWDLEKAADRDFALADCTFAPPQQVTPQEAAKVLLEADDYMPTTAKLAAIKAHLGRDSKVQPVAIAEAWRAALRALANGGDSDE